MFCYLDVLNPNTMNLMLKILKYNLSINYTLTEIRNRRMKNAIYGTVLTLLLACILIFKIPAVKAYGTIYVMADGSVYPLGVPLERNGNLYTLTGNITFEGSNGIVIERSNIIVDGAGYTIKEAGGEIGIMLSGRSNVTLKNMEITAFYDGIELNSSSNCRISGNYITANSNYGIWLTSSSSSSISGNNVTHNWEGIHLNYSSNCGISGNRVGNNGIGIMLQYYSSDNAISGNNVTANYGNGIFATFSSGNTLSSNNVVNNGCGIWFAGSSDNSVFHNNFLNNTKQVRSIISNNTWDSGYPSGGNYWSNYTGTDANHDGIGDTPYIIDANNTDHYPLMIPYVIPEFPSFIIPSLFLIATLLAVIVHQRKHKILL